MKTKTWSEFLKIPRLGIAQIMFWIVWLSISFALVHETTNFQNRSQTIHEIAISPNGEFFAIAGSTDTRVYNESKRIAILPATIKGNDALRFLDDETLAIVTPSSSQTNGGIHFFSIPSRSIDRCFSLNNPDQRAVVTADRIIVQECPKFGGHQFLTYAIDANSNDAPITRSQSPYVNTGMTISRDGRYAAFFWRNGKRNFLQHLNELDSELSVIYDIRDEEKVSGLPVGNSVRFDPRDRIVIVCGLSIDCFEWPSKEKRWTIPDMYCTGIRFSPDGSKFGVRNLDTNCLHIFGSESGNQLQIIPFREESGVAFSFSADSDGVWIPSDDQAGGVDKIDISSKTVFQKIGGSHSPTRWIVFYLLFTVWAVAFTKCIPGPRNPSWFAFWCIAPGGCLLPFFAINSFFTDIPRSLEFGSYSNFYFILAMNYSLLAITSFMTVCACRCCPILKTKLAAEKTID